MPPFVRILGATAAVALAAFIGQALTGGPSDTGVGAAIVKGVFPGIFVLTAAICFARASRGGRERTTWLLYGAGQLLEAFGWVAYALADGRAQAALSDAGWIGGYVLYMAAMLSLLHARLGHQRLAPWLDGAVAALTIGAIAAGFVVEEVVQATGGSATTVVRNLAYPCIDLLFLALLSVVFANNRWRPSGLWSLLAAAIACQVVVDSIYLDRVALGTYHPGTLLDAGWAAAALLVAVAAWLPREPRETASDSAPPLFVQLVPTAFALVALVMLAYDHFAPLPDVAAALAWLAIVAGAARSASAYARARTVAVERDGLEHMAAILNSAGEGIYMLDAAGVVIYANPATERTLGYAPEELIGREMHAAIHHSHADGSTHGEIECPVARALADGRERRVSEDCFWPKDGRPVPVDYTVTPILKDGVTTGAAIVFIDVTARLRAERDAAAQQAVARVVAVADTLDEARAGFIQAICDNMGFEAAAAWIGAKSGPLRCVLTYGAFDIAPLGAELGPGEGAPARALASGRVETVTDGPRASVIMPIINGSSVIGVTELALAEGAEPDASMLATLETIGAQAGQYAARRRAEAEADRMKNEFFALVSHELRTPLTSILGYLDIALEDDDLDPDLRHVLTVVERNSTRLLRLVGDLLFVAKVEGGEMALELGSVDLATLAADAVEAAAPRALEGGITLSLHGDAVPELRGDRGRLGQAIDNLVSNAIKFTPEGGEVRVAVRAEGDVALIEVSDTGIGISANDQRRMFDRFYRSAQANERAIQGVGLGLSIVKSIVGAHGGSIEVESVEGSGTTFRASIPLPVATGAPDALPADQLPV